MEIKNKELTLIKECCSDDLSITSCKFCWKVENSSVEDSVFSSVNMTGAFFAKGEMRGAEFDQMGMTNCIFKSSNMTRPDFNNVGMTGAMFRQVDMERSDFYGTGLANTTFVNCDLKNVIIRNCKYAGMEIDGYDVQELIEFYKNNHKGE